MNTTKADSLQQQSQPAAEMQRLEALASYDILDTLPEEEYDDITQIASYICQTPVSLITFVDEHRQWFKSAHGIAVRETPRQYSFCSYAIQTPEQLLEIQDTRLDERFAHFPYTTQEPGVIFYAGVPLIDEAGQALGTLCVVDHQPRRLSEKQVTTLKALARQVVSLLKLRRSQNLLKKANQQLHDSNHILQAVVSNCPAGLVLLDVLRDRETITDFQYVFTNPANSAITGYSVEAMNGNSLKALFPNVVRQGMFDQLTTVVQTREPRHFQPQFNLPTGPVWSTITLVPVGERVLLTIQDITPLKKIEEQLQAHTENLEQIIAERTTEMSHLLAMQKAILNHAGQAILSTDTKGRIQTVNPAAERLLGYTADELIGKISTRFMESIDPPEAKGPFVSHRPDRLKLRFSFHKLESYSHGDECRLLTKQGQRMPVLLTTTAMRDEAGNLIGYIGLATDISPLKKAEEELMQKNRQLNVFFNSSLDLHCIATPGGTIVRLNRSWETMLGLSTAEVQGKSLFTYLHPNDTAYTLAAVQEGLTRGYVDKLVNRMRSKDGSYRLIEWRLVLDGNLFYTSARDITESRSAAARLQRVNERLQLATQAAKQGIWEYDLHQDTVVWDKQLYRVYGLSEQTTITNLADVMKHVHPDDRQQLLLRLADLEQGTDYFDFQQRIIQPSGRFCYIQCKGVVLRNETGKPARLVGVVWDVTEQKQAEQTLRKRKEQYRQLVDNLREVVYKTDLQGNWTFLNLYWTVLTGLPTEESLGQPFHRFLSRRNQLQLYRLFENLLTTPHSSFRHTIRYQQKNGDLGWAEVFCQLLVNDEGAPVGTTGTITDITDRKETLDALHESNQRFLEFAENIDEVIFIHSANPFELQYVNSAYERIWGLSCQSLYADQSSAFQRVLEEDRPASRKALVSYKDGEPSTVQYRIRKADGSVRWINSRTFTLKNQHGKPLRFIGIASDITDQKEKELVLQQSLIREQELNRMKSQFVATASHEFRTPLATIQSSVDLIRLYLERPPETGLPAVGRHLDVIEREIANFSELLADVLMLGKMDAGKIPFSPQPVDMLALTNEVVSTHFSEWKDNRRVNVIVRGAPCLVRVDPKLITHTLINLLSNAFKFSSTNPELSISFNQQLTIAVTDQGIGIPADELPNLFSSFFRARNAVNIHGSGLGLVIVRQFVELHGGTIHVESIENQGTTVTVTLPVTCGPSVV
ncbi:PAS domain S-box protein [Spirosoma taeanense]|uniref:histidine kinase n=1 Tax=Spirosoma taeanense TaxID=2735870 RepID=A0A6M5Y6D2_9BACT|nr:PAS domain S-box protein [Spirosoma taeanense]QJW89987.1 PAS domain S-box protein [Spirosoma taeanense]